MTERKRTETNSLLEEVTAELQAVIDAVPAYIFVKDRENRFLRGNKAFAKSVGVHVTELPGRSAFDLFPRELAERFWADDLEVITSGKAKTGVVEEGWREGSRGWFSTDRIPRRNEEGEIVGVIGIARDITAQLEASEKLREKSELLQNVLESLTHPFYVIDAEDYTITLANPAAKFDGVPGGRTCYELTHRRSEPCRDDHPCPLNIVKETKRTTKVEHVHYDRDGNPRVFEIHAYPLLDKDGNVERLIEYSLDITERKKVEEALRDSEGRLRSFYQAAFEGIVISHEGRLIDMNPRFTEIFGYSREELIGMDVLALVHAEDRERVAERIRSGYDRPYEHRGVHKDGSILFLEVHGQTIQSHGRRVRVATVNDISERQKAVEALRESEAKYRTLFEESRDSLLLSTPGGRILDANKAAVTLLGVGHKEDLFGLDVKRDVYDNPEDRERFQEVMHSRGFVNDFETVIKRRDGRRLTVLVSGNVVRDGGGDIGAYRVTVRDISERKLLRDQLLQAQKMESLGVLAGGIAHDFNNILTPIMAHVGYMQMVLSAESPLREDLEEIMRASERARELVRQILAFSRREETRREAVELQPLVKETLRLLRATLPATIAIREVIDAAAGPVLADATQLHQVLMNLCTNAHQAMRDTGGVLEVRLDDRVRGTGFEGDPAGLAPGRYTVVEVKDAGPGMEEGMRSRIFEPYFTTKGSGEGSGLGLAVAHGIVRSHGGGIGVESEPGEGTTMTVWLPAIEAAQKGALEEPDNLPRGTERILFIDDEPEILRIGSRILSSLGYRVTSFDSSVRGLEEFLADPNGYDIILTDQTLPEMAGSKVAERVLQVRPEMPIVICTGYSHELDEKKAREIGARSLLLKPFTMPALAEAVREALDHPGA